MRLTWPDGKYAYVASNFEKVLVVSTKSNTVIANITGFHAPNRVAITPDGKYAYVTDGLNKSVSVINTSTYAVEYVISVGTYPCGVVIAPNGQYVYVTDVAYLPGEDAFSVTYFGLVSIISTNISAVEDGKSGAESLSKEIASNSGSNISVPNVSYPVDPHQLLLVLVLGVFVIVSFLGVKFVKRRKQGCNSGGLSAKDTVLTKI